MNLLKLTLLFNILFVQFIALACGPMREAPFFFPYPSYFTYEYLPITLSKDNEFSKRYISGNIPVIPSDTNMLGWIINYRYLMGVSTPIDKFRLIDNANSDAKENWIKHSTRILNNSIKDIQTVKFVRKIQGEEEISFSFLNCNDKAFNFALEQLSIKEPKYSKEALENWVINQNKVFENCSSKELILPILKDQLSQEEIDDIRYQTASAYFYFTDYKKSAELFDEISKDPNSSYKDLALYLIFRSYFRQANYFDGSTQLFQEKFNAYSEQINISTFQESINQLNRYFITNEDPHSVIIALADKLTTTTFDMVDLEDWRYLYLTKRQYYTEHPFINWIHQWQDQSIKFEDTYEEWQHYKTFPRLILALEKITALDLPFKQYQDLIKAIEAIPITDRHYTLIQQYLIKLALLEGDLDKVKSITETTLDNEALALYEKNLFHFLHSFAAKNFKSYLNDIIQPIVFYFEEDIYSPLPINQGMPISGFPDYSYNFIQIVPINLLIDAIQYDIPIWLKQRFISSAWIRYILLEDITSAKEITDIVINFYPELRNELLNFKTITEVNESLLFANLIIMDNPGLSLLIENSIWRNGKSDIKEIDRSGLQEHWWPNDLSGIAKKKASNKIQPTFLTSNEQKLAEHEWEFILNKLGPNTTDYFCTKTINAFNQNIKAEFLPEMLHRCVVMSRFNASSKGIEVPFSSLQAFNILHKYFKTHPFTLKTPYHFYKKNN